MTNVDTNPISTHNTLTAQHGHSHALAFARKGGLMLSNLLHSIAQAKETERKGPLWGFVFITDTYSEDERAMIPVIGSRQKEGSNEPFDRYTSTAKVDGADKTIQGSWLTDAVRATPEYVMVQHRVECCDDVTIADCPADIKAMGSVARAQEKQRLTQWKKDMRTGLGNSVMLFKQVERISALNPAKIKVRLPLRQEKDPATGEERTVVFSNIIRLEDLSKEHEDILLNVNQFNALKPDKIPAGEEATIKTLELTGARAPKGKKKKGAADIVTPNTVELFLNFCNVGGTAIDPDTAEGQRLNAAILQAAAGTGDKADDVVETFGDFAMRIDQIWTLISGRYMQIKQAKLAKKNVQAIADAAADAAKRRAQG